MLKLFSNSYFLLLFIIISCNNDFRISQETNFSKLDSISVLIKESNNPNKLLDERKNYLLAAHSISDSILNDSLKNENLLKLSYAAYKLDDRILFYKFNKEAYSMSEYIKDDFGIGKTHYYKGNFHLKREENDSAFYHFDVARKYFRDANKVYNVGKMFYNMAIIQKNVKDFTGSEVSIFSAIKIFKKLDKPQNLYYCYNLLGVNYKELREYEKAVLFHTKALSIATKIKSNEGLLELSKNNLGVAYQAMGNHEKAIENFEIVFTNFENRSQNTKAYARVLDNLNYSRLLIGDTLRVSKNLFRAHNLRDSLNYISGLVVSKKHLAEYYKIKRDTIKAIQYSKESGKLAISIRNNKDYLASLKLLSKLDPENSGAYLDNYIKLNDSLQIAERKLRNKFTRIRFETDEHIQEKEKVSLQFFISAIVFLILILALAILYIIKIKRSKSMKLRLLEEQQKANEEIYNLILKQQSLIDKGRVAESRRISEELHDGIIGRIFGVRLTFGFIDFKGSDEEMNQFKSLINELKEVEQEVRNISHQLSGELFASKQDFKSLLFNLLKNNSEIGSYKYGLDINKSINWGIVEGIIKINIFRIIQESLQNCYKHSDATLVEVSLNKEKENLILKIKDNGRGFDTTNKKNGIGLKNIKSRVSKINGKCTIESEAGEGTTITVIVPNIIEVI